jgi:hypothetical protein
MRKDPPLRSERSILFEWTYQTERIAAVRASGPQWQANPAGYFNRGIVSAFGGSGIEFRNAKMSAISASEMTLAV